MSSSKPNTKATTTTTTIHKHEMAKMSKTRCCAWVLRRYVYRDAAVKLLTASTSHWTSLHSDRLPQGHTNTNTTTHDHLCDSTARYRTRYRSRYRTRYRTRKMSKTRCCAGYSKVVYRDAGCGSVTARHTGHQYVPCHTPAMSHPLRPANAPNYTQRNISLRASNSAHLHAHKHSNTPPAVC